MKLISGGLNKTFCWINKNLNWFNIEDEGHLLPPAHLGHSQTAKDLCGGGRKGWPRHMKGFQMQTHSYWKVFTYLQVLTGMGRFN